ncbi:family 78 glycoside hydrolase catalytic domain [Microbacterium sp. STN6]|uniref:alpha-L-rhamnosidase n=1 Tax=Microbacterium sp. STN6 TaxID=2995588 RepID=UPI002260C3FA|nr:alpha-L-rhamnosidase [Microbacterium sp. STN6]MCX7522854.1 family 78 glycoside hydrolase catalytic domain [Microbacterium sp. STN6]
MTNDPLAGAAFLTADVDRDVAPRFHTDVELLHAREDVVSAVLRVTAHGVYEARIDGTPVTESVLNPGWTAYEWRLQYQEYDVAATVATGVGPLSLELLLGNGWYRGDLGFAGAHANYGDEISVAAALEITYRNGVTERVTTTSDWNAYRSEITRNSLYNGQTIDARLRGKAGAITVREVDIDRSTLVPTTNPLVMRHETLRPVKIWTATSGETLVDFGQNLVGWLRFTVQGDPGDRIEIRHAEVLEDGELGVRPLRGAQARDELILSGGADFFEPTLTFHGFRYAGISGWPGEIRAESIEAVVVHSEMRRTGHFACSEPLVNQLVHNSVWGQKGNFLSVPTDCPQRDERLGWTGDIAAYAASASFQFDTADFLDSWLADLLLETEHSSDRGVPLVVPDVLKYAHFPEGFSLPPWAATAIWGDASIWVPQALWTAYGDEKMLASHYPAMKLHLESVERYISPTDLWDLGHQLGDWLDPDAPDDQPDAAKADPHVVAQACLYRSASFAAETAARIGLVADADRWSKLAARTRAAFNDHYVEEGLVKSDCATVYALAIAFDLLDENDRVAAGERLAEIVRESGFRVTTGFAGTPFVTWALSDTGHVNEAYALLLEKECPSWLYPVTIGATTVWERWDSMLQDGSINPGEMTSFNHYALGAVADWIYQVIGGVRPAEPGYTRVRIQPVPGPGLAWAETTYDSGAGRIDVAWRLDENRFTLRTSLPESTPAEIALPNGEIIEVLGGTHEFTVTL